MRTTIIAFAICCSPTIGQAADVAQYELTPMVGWQVGGQFRDSDTDAGRDLDESAVYGLILNKKSDEYSQWEMYLARQSTQFDTSLERPGASPFGLDVDYYHIGGNVAFDGPIGTSFVSGTLGATRLQPDDSAFDNSTRFSFAIGGGVKIPLGDLVAARLELRALGTVMNNDTGLFCLSDSDGATCAVALDGRIFWQLAATAGISFQFR